MAFMLIFALGGCCGYLYGRNVQRKAANGRTKKGLLFSDRLLRKG